MLKEMKEARMGNGLSGTLEGFFVDDYKRIREENERLRKENGELHGELEKAKECNGFGVFDLHKSTMMVKVNVVSGGTLTDRYEGITLESLREALGMDDNALWFWGMQSYKSTERWYSALMPITIDYHTFQYTLRVIESRFDRTYVTDADKRYDDLYEAVEPDGEDCLGEWVDAERDDEVKRIALGRLRKSIRYAIEHMEAEDGDKS